MNPGTALKHEVNRVSPAGHEKGDADVCGQGYAKLNAAQTSRRKENRNR